MKWLKALQMVALGLGLAYTLPLACGSGGIVGGKCKGRTVSCDGQCCDPDTGLPVGGASNPGGGSGPGQAGNNTAAAAGENPGVGGNGELPDGGFFDSPVDGMGDADAPLECMPPYNTPSNCGACGNKCVDPDRFCAPDDEGGFHCVPLCEDPLVECNGRCVIVPDAYLSDPDNCGSCGNQCPSDICQGGKCVGAKYGNVALICMDFNSNAKESAPTVLLGNAVYAPAKNPVRVLEYTRGANPAAVSRVHTVIGWAGEPRNNRTASFTEAKTVDAVTNNLNINDFDVFLVHDLVKATAGDPAVAASTWEAGSVLTSFGRAGGVIVVLDGAEGTGEMHELINAGNLLDPQGQVSLDGQTDMTLDQVWNNAPFDVLGVNVLSPFLGTSHTCTFDTTAMPSADTIFVLTDDQKGGKPVAIHRVIAP